MARIAYQRQADKRTREARWPARPRPKPAWTAQPIIRGSARFNGYDCPATDARVAAANTLCVTASGGSSLFYKGDTTVFQTLSGGGTVTRE